MRPTGIPRTPPGGYRNNLPPENTRPPQGEDWVQYPTITQLYDPENAPSEPPDEVPTAQEEGYEEGDRAEHYKEGDVEEEGEDSTIPSTTERVPLTLRTTQHRHHGRRDTTFRGNPPPQDTGMDELKNLLVGMEKKRVEDQLKLERKLESNLGKLEKRLSMLETIDNKRLDQMSIRGRTTSNVPAVVANANQRNPRPIPSKTPPQHTRPFSTNRDTLGALPRSSRTLRGGDTENAERNASSPRHDDPLGPDTTPEMDRNRDDESRVTRGPALKVDDVGEFTGKDVEHYIRSIEIISEIYGEEKVLLVLPKCMKKLARDWFISLSPDDRGLVRSLDGWIYLLREAFGEDLRRCRDKANARVFQPWKESVEEYFYDKAALHRRAESSITEVEVMREIWKGLAPHATELMVVSWKQHNQREFRDELIQRVEISDTLKRSNRSGNGEKRKPFGGRENGRGGYNGKDTRGRDRGRSSSRWQKKDAKDDGEKKKDWAKDREKDKDRDSKKESSSAKKSYKTTTRVSQVKDDSEEEASEEEEDQSIDEESEDEVVEEKRTKVYLVKTRNYFSFLNSRTCIAAAESKIRELPTPASIGDGLSFLNGQPLPIEVWLQRPGPTSPTVMGCGDSGGQCLIKQSIVEKHIPDAKIEHNPNCEPDFEGVGGGKTRTLGHISIPIYIPDEKVLNGDKGEIVKLVVEFQVVKELDCNFLIGRDATRAYGMDFIESEGVIKIGRSKIPIADCNGKFGSREQTVRSCVYVTKNITIAPHSDAAIPISIPGGYPAKQTLIFTAKSFVDGPRETHGRMPYTLCYKSTPVLTFANMCDYAIRLKKGEIVGEVEIVGPDTRMTYFASPKGCHAKGTKDNGPSKAASEEKGKREQWRKKTGKCEEESTEKKRTSKPAKKEAQRIVFKKPGETGVSSSMPSADDAGVNAFGLHNELEMDDRQVEFIDLTLEPKFRPTPDSKTLRICIDKDLTIPMKDALMDLIKKFAACFSFEGKRLGKIQLPAMRIDTESGKTPNRTHPYRESPRTSKLISEAMETLKNLDIIEKGYGPVASPVVMVLQNGKYRFCVDFRAVNAITPLDRYPIPRPDAVFTALSGAVFFSTMDANKGYHQFDISPESRWLTAFTTEKEGQWQYKRVPFGLQNAPAFFQRSIDSLLGRWRWQFVLAYIDDVVVWSKSWDEHLEHLGKVLDAFKRVGLTLDERKCNFGFSSVDLLGLRVSRLGLRTLEQKTEAIACLPFPQTVKQLRQILGQFSYYRQFIDKFAIVAEPLTTALRAAEKDALVGLTAKERAKKIGRQMVIASQDKLDALEKLKKLLSCAPVLRYPDYEKPFVLYTDASGKGIAGALHQEHDGKQHPIVFISRALSPAEKNYSATEMECLGVYWSFMKLSHFLDGSMVTVVTDHLALQWLWSIQQTTNSRLHRWAMLLGPLESRLKIIHRPGLANSNVDPLSRFPSTKSLFTTSLIPDMKLKFILGYISDEFFAGHVADASRKKNAKQGKDFQSVAVFEQLGRVGSPEENDVVNQSVAAQGQLGRVGTTEMENNDTQSVTAKQLGRVGIVGENTTQSVAAPEQLGRVGIKDIHNSLSVTAPEQLGRTEIMESPVYHIDEEGLLIRVYKNTEVLCVPKSCQQDICKLTHDEYGHPGSRRAILTAQKNFFWPGMTKDIENYCKTCHACQVVKTDTQKKPGVMQPIPATSPLHTMCIDFVEGLPPCRGFDALATVTDKYTKAIRLIPCKKNDTAEVFAKRYFESIFPTWGIPKVIISDRDRKFSSNFWQSLMALSGTKVAMTTAHHPQSDGQSERTNRTVEATLRILILEREERWVDLLPAVEFAHNSCTNVSTGHSPFHLLYGVSPKNFGDLVAKMAVEHSVSAEEMMADLLSRRETAEKAMIRAQAHQKKYFDKKHSELTFAPGELACLKYLRKGKLDPTSQVVTIVGMVSPGAYRIKVPEGSRMHDVISIEHLRKYKPREGFEPKISEGTAESKDAIIKILGERVMKGKREVLCLREGQTEEDASWENVEIGNLKKLTEEFGKRWSAGDGKKKKKEQVVVEKLPKIDGVEITQENEVGSSKAVARASGRRRIPSRKARE